MKSIVVLISGNGSNLQAILDACASGFIDGEVCAVISNKANVLGLDRAKEAGSIAHCLPHQDYPTRHSYDQALQQLIDSHKPDLVVLAGFMRILTPEFVQHYSGKLLNIHPSLLPKYQGLHTHQRAMEAGDSIHGCSVHFVTEELDGGPVVLQARVPIFPEDELTAVTERVHEQEYSIYPLVIRWFCQGRLHQEGNLAFLDNEPLPEHGYANDDDEYDL
ncbi:phosphoribosylglycinamide formyltransferase [Alkalimonas collagenimarina]|uniref:Phosphoribosylglycinamide formyltransferase n=1 Tax=Alkalimonas collagenimarina TaxID=400390 RepID=A0ABT9GXN1_9GAMM|nr:phosphoribosylglycinamide formyltransferase [Alkalimonas collagenimarina]MDP4535820.1 phosphoribosylglycinamide formyltransferase [Alkalimonas collagenimarina]